MLHSLLILGGRYYDENREQPPHAAGLGQDLMPREMEALRDWYHTDPNELLTPREVLECIVSWEGGIASAYHIKSIIGRVYSIEL